MRCLILLAAAALCPLVLGFPPSPCPQYFRYASGPQGAPIATASVPVSLNQIPITLRLHLAIRVALKTKYVGMLTLADHPTLVLGNLLAGRTKVVNYTVRFPLPHPIPLLREVAVNNKTICRGDELEISSVFGGVITNIFLEHTFPAQPFPIRNKAGIDKDPQFPYGDQDKNNKSVRCGITKDLYSEDSSVSQIENWPWLAAIFLKDEHGIRFHCAGSLISSRHVVTAAHCARNQINRNWNASNFVVYLGINNFNKYGESSLQIKKVQNIQIHPEYNELKYEADIAILVIENTTINDYVSPVCLWNGGTSLKPLIGHLGTVVGWSLDETTKTIRSEPEVFQLPIVDQAECLRSRKEFLYITSERTLCAGLRNGTGPCNGDSGSGLIILSYNNKNSLAWHLRGIISLSLLDQKKGTCDLNEYIVFTDIARFSQWISHVTLYY